MADCTKLDITNFFIHQVSNTLDSTSNGKDYS